MRSLLWLDLAAPELPRYCKILVTQRQARRTKAAASLLCLAPFFPSLSFLLLLQDNLILALLTVFWASRSIMGSGIGRVYVGLPDAANEVQMVPTQGSIGQGLDEARAQRVETAENTYQYQQLVPGHIRCPVLYPGTE